jgi:hypothetical protein
MEAQAPYNAASKGPRNLTVPLAAWLRTQGFTALEQLLPFSAAVSAHWTGPQGEHFLLEYAWVAGPAPSATCQLRVLHPSRTFFEPLFTAQSVRRLRDVRLLLLGNVRYANARTLAGMVPAS